MTRPAGPDRNRAQGRHARPPEPARGPRRAGGVALLLAACLSALAGCSSGSSTAALEPHPFLLLRGNDLAALRARATRPPWRELADRALTYAEQETFDPFAPEFEAKTRLTDLCGALALAWILDPRPAFADKLRATLASWPDFYVASAPSGEGVAVRWRQAAMLSTILALDVMRDALEPAELTAAEDMLGGMVAQWWALRAQDGTTSTPGITVVWALYARDRALTAAAKSLYLERLFGALTPSGVYDSGTGYAWVRLAGDRLGKYAPVDVLVASGEEPDLYADPRLRGLIEWMFAGAYTPLRRNTTFGDTDPSRPLEGLLGYTQPYSAWKYSAQAGRNAAWLVRDVEPRPILANYVLMDESILAPAAPVSGLWGDTASFWEDAAASASLMGALWSPRSKSSHSHADVNAVHLYAYGKNVLRNSGYCGSGVGIDATFDWEWVHSTAASSNTLTIDGVDHVDKLGGGILEGLTARGFDYAAASSGPALPNGAHTRSLVLVHGTPALPGYFVLFDEVAATLPGSEVRIALHPDSNALATISARTQYEATIGPLGSQVFATLFLGTEPARASILDGGLCAFDGNEFVGKCLESAYPSDGSGKENVVTLIVPHDAGHAEPGLERLTLPGSFTGARVLLAPGVDDVVLESSGTTLAVLGPESFRARALHFRRAQAALPHYFARLGRSFDDGSPQRVGFESDAEVSLFVRGTEAWITARTGATVVFHDPLLVGDSFDTPAGTVLSAAPGRIEIALLPGTHALDLASGAVLGRP